MRKEWFLIGLLVAFLPSIYGQVVDNFAEESVVVDENDKNNVLSSDPKLLSENCESGQVCESMSERVDEAGEAQKHVDAGHNPFLYFTNATSPYVTDENGVTRYLGVDRFKNNALIMRALADQNVAAFKIYFDVRNDPKNRIVPSRLTPDMLGPICGASVSHEIVEPAEIMASQAWRDLPHEMKAECATYMGATLVGSEKGPFGRVWQKLGRLFKR